jgi:hypothetical protein
MNAHAAAPVPRQHRRPAGTVPLLLGVAVGLYAVFLEHTQGAPAGRAWLVGLITCAVTAVICYAVGRVQDGLMREVRAATYGAVFGGAMGYLLSLSGWTILKASLVGLVLGMSMVVVSFYLFYTHQR